MKKLTMSHLSHSVSLNTFYLFLHLAVGHPDNDCSTQALQNCSFSDTFCNWTHNGWISNFDSVSFDVDIPHLSGHLTSDLACSTAGATHCLSFGFVIYDDVSNASDLTVTVQHGAGDARNETVWIVTPNSTTIQWCQAAVPVRTQTDFRVVFQASRKQDRSPVIYVKNVGYSETACELWPLDAAPPSDAPSSDAPSSDAPSSHAPSSDAPSSHAPSSHAPSSHAPSSDAPSSDAPSSRAPSSGAPSSDAPSSGTPASQASSSHAPSIDAPSSGAPSSHAPHGTTETSAVSSVVPDKHVMWMVLLVLFGK